MARPRRAQPAPSWASSSRMTNAAKATLKKTANTNLQVVLYDRPRYVAGVSGGRSGPITLVPPHDADAYIVDKVVTPFDGWGAQAATAEEYDTDEEDARYAADPARRTVQRVLNYVVGWPDEPYARALVPCTQILDYVSPYALEAYEYELCERQRQRREKPHFKAHETDTATANREKRKGETKKQAKAEKREHTRTAADAKAATRTAQQRDGNGKFLPKGTPAKTATSTQLSKMPQMSQMSQIAQITLDSPAASLGLSPSRHAGLAQPVVSLSMPLSFSSFSSLSPSKPRTSQGRPQTQPTLSLKRPYDRLVDEAGTTATATPTETETESVSMSEDDDEDEDSGEDELHVSLPRVTPVPLPAFASALPASSAPTSKAKPASTSTSTSTSSSSRKITRVSPPHVIGMRSEALHKRVKVEDGKDRKTERREKRETRVTPIPPPVYHKSKPTEQPPDEPEDPEDPEDDLYEVDRLEGDCYTYIDDDDADGTAPQDGTPAPKKLVQYFYVRWKGNWPPDQNPTWEPAENLPPRMVQQYLRNLARQEQAREQSQLAAQLGQDHRQQAEELLGLSSDDGDDDDDASQDDVAPIVFSDIQGASRT